MKSDVLKLVFCSGVLVVLKNPYPRDIEEPGVYETVKVHGVFGSDKGPAGPAHAAVSYIYILNKTQIDVQLGFLVESFDQ